MPATTLPPSASELLTEASVRTLTAWTPPLILAAEVQAGTGRLSLAADLVEGLLFGDDGAPAVGRTRTNALFGLRPTFEAGGDGDGRRQGRVVRALEGAEDYWEIFPTALSKQIFTWGLFLGIAPVRLLWWETLPLSKRRVVRIRKGRMVPAVELWHPRNLRQDALDGQWKIRLSSGQERTVVHGDGEWLLFTPYGPHRPQMWAPWRGLARWALLKLLGVGDWGRHSEQASQTVIESDKDVEVTPELRKELAASLKASGANAKIVLPRGMKARRLESTSSGDLYRQQGEAADKAETVALTGHELNAKGAGAETGAENSQAIRYDLRADDAEVWSEFTRSGALTWWALHNFGSRDLAPWACYPVKRPNALLHKGQGLKALGEGVVALKAADPAINTHKLLEDEQLPMLTPEQVAREAADKAARTPSPPPAPAPAPSAAPDPAPAKDGASDDPEEADA